MIKELRNLDSGKFFYDNEEEVEERDERLNCNEGNIQQLEVNGKCGCDSGIQLQ